MFLQKSQNKTALDKATMAAIMEEWGATDTYTSFNKLLIKGSKFAIKIGEETKTLMKGKTPIQELQVIFCRNRPANSRAFYQGDFEEGVALPPDCSSRDGLTPDADVENPQSPDCRTCPMAVLGTAKMGKGAACRQHRTMIVLIVKPDGTDVMRDTDGEPLPFQIDVPLMSLNSRQSKHGSSGFNEYVKQLASVNLRPHQVVTELTFNPDTNFPMLAFEHALNLDDDGAAVVEVVRENPDVLDITDVTSRALPPATKQRAIETADKPAAKPEKKAKPVAVVEDEDDDLEDAFDTAATTDVTSKPSKKADTGQQSLDDLDFDGLDFEE